MQRQFNGNTFYWYTDICKVKKHERPKTTTIHPKKARKSEKGG